LVLLLLSLAVSDVGVGFLFQPFYISLIVKESQQNIDVLVQTLGERGGESKVTLTG